MSTADLAKRYRRELAAAKPRLDPIALPPAWALNMHCVSCGEITGLLWREKSGERVRRCGKCEEGRGA